MMIVWIFFILVNGQDGQRVIANAQLIVTGESRKKKLKVAFINLRKNYNAKSFELLNKYKYKEKE